jgi:glycosyltransferase involved in cell wall biosynthesis
VILAKALRDLGVDVHTTGHDSFVPDEAFDLIHVHHVGRAAYVMAVSDTRCPFIFTGHDGQMLCGYERSLIRRSAFNFVVGRSDAVVALTEHEAGFMRKLGHRNVAVIPNGIPPGYADAPLTHDRDGMIFVGQLIPLKGVDVLLRAMTLMRHRETPLTLAYHNAQLEAELQGLAQELGLKSRVRFAGPRSPDQLVDLYARSKLLVLPSHAESLPSVITEALLAGTPVVASRVGGIPDQLGKFGRLVEPGDAGALARALDMQLDLPPDLPTRQAMRDYATARFGPAAMATRHAALYEAVAAARRNGRRGRDPFSAALRVAIATYWARPRPLERD